MKNSCEVSSQILVYLTNLVTMFKFVLENQVNGSNQQKQEKWLWRSPILFSIDY